ncbi:MAG: response regulator [Chthoniobacteraceae bacterium]
MSQPRALLVVESPGIELFYRRTLSGVGLDVVSVRDGESALAQLRTPQPVIIALDLQLSGMGGIEFMRNLRVQRAAAAPPVVVLPLLDSQLTAAANGTSGCRLLTHEQAPLKTLALLAHTQARLQGAPAMPVPPAPAEWLPHALAHLVALHEIIHTLGREPGLAEVRRRMASEAHGLAELLHLADEPGLAELAVAFEALVIERLDLPEGISGSSMHTLGQVIDFLGAHLRQFTPRAVQSARGSRILVVDDESLVGQLVAAALDYSGFESHIADSPSACLSAVQTSVFDLVLLDIGLPEMSGFDLIGHIRNSDAHATVPILFLTGMTTFQNRAKAVLTGGNDFIPKPFDPLELGLKALLWIQLRRTGAK